MFHQKYRLCLLCAWPWLSVFPTPDQTFRPDQTKNLAAGEKIRPPLQNLLTNADITVFYTLFLSAKRTKILRYQEMKCTFLQIFYGFYVNNHLQKSSAPFRPFFGIFKENSAANFSGRTNCCGAPLRPKFRPLSNTAGSHQLLSLA
jgi:hypothetical protein